MTLTIEAGIPTPLPARREPYGETRIALEKMEVGESFFTPSAAIRRRALTTARYMGNIRVCTAKVKDGFRVWRIE